MSSELQPNFYVTRWHFVKVLGAWGIFQCVSYLWFAWLGVAGWYDWYSGSAIAKLVLECGLFAGLFGYLIWPLNGIHRSPLYYSLLSLSALMMLVNSVAVYQRL